MPFYVFDFLPYVFGIHVCDFVAPLVPLLAFHNEKLFLGFLLGCPEFSFVISSRACFEDFGEAAHLSSPFLASGGRKECRDLKGLGVDRGIAKVAASWRPADKPCNI